MNKLLLSTVLLVTAVLIAQPKRYTKGAENGYTWLSLENPGVVYSDAKYNYLSGMLEKYRTLNEKFPEVERIDCRDDVNILLENGMSDKLSLDDMVDAIDKFYGKSDNLVIPIVFAYCYSIKEIAGLSKDELNNYRNELLKFCEDNN